MESSREKCNFLESYSFSRSTRPSHSFMTVSCELSVQNRSCSEERGAHEH